MVKEERNVVGDLGEGRTYGDEIVETKKFRRKQKEGNNVEEGKQEDEQKKR